MISFIGKNVPSKTRSLLDLTRDYSILMNERSKKHSWQGLGPLSLKVALQGEANYEVEGKKLRIDKNRFMVLNDFQEYKINVNSPYQTETFIIFFKRDLIHSVSETFQMNEDQLIDHGPVNNLSALSFKTQTMQINPYVISEIRSLQSLMLSGNIEHQAIQEKLYTLFEHLIVQEFSKESNAPFSKTKSSTRTEIQKRISLAIDYLHALYDKSITLDELSRESCLSKNHLLRSFKRAYGITPFQYLSHLRVEKAKDLLKDSDLPITHICNLIGFESLGYFSWMFKRQTGLSPTAYREQV